MSYRKWEYRWFGFFNEPSEEQNAYFLPNIEDFQSKKKANDIDKVITYLRNSPNILRSFSIPTNCMFCDKYHGDPNSYYYDGVWLWPEWLIHYVECHDVILPEEFLAHIKSKNYIPVDSVEFTVEGLPWPDE